MQTNMNSLPFASNLKNKTKQVDMKNNTSDVLIKAKNNYCASRNYSIENKVSLSLR